jgi:hypothetical protein
VPAAAVHLDAQAVADANAYIRALERGACGGGPTPSGFDCEDWSRDQRRRLRQSDLRGVLERGCPSGVAPAFRMIGARVPASADCVVFRGRRTSVWLWLGRSAHGWTVVGIETQP